MSQESKECEAQTRADVVFEWIMSYFTHNNHNMSALYVFWSVDKTDNVVFSQGYIGNSTHLLYNPLLVCILLFLCTISVASLHNLYCLQHKQTFTQTYCVHCNGLCQLYTQLPHFQMLLCRTVLNIISLFNVLVQFFLFVPAANCICASVLHKNNIHWSQI